MKTLLKTKYTLIAFILFVVLSNVFVPQGTLSFLRPILSFNLLAEAHETHSAELKFVPDDSYLPSILNDIASANSRIYIAMFFFKADGRKNNPSTMIEKALMCAAENGIDVNVVLEKSGRKKDLSTKVNTHTAKYLEKAGIKVRYDGNKNKMHAKAIVIDDIVYIGSHNFTKSAMTYNHEASVRIESASLAKEVIDYIQNIK